MKSPSYTQHLAGFAARLKDTSPQAWDEFVECFDAYATQVTVAVTTAEQHEILVAQGRAKAFLHLLDTFRNCHAISRPPPPPPPPQP